MFSALFANSDLLNANALISTLRDTLHAERNRRCSTCERSLAEVEYLKESLARVLKEKDQLWRVFMASNNAALSRVGAEPIASQEAKASQTGDDLFALIAGAQVG